MVRVPKGFEILQALEEAVVFFKAGVPETRVLDMVNRTEKTMAFRVVLDKCTDKSYSYEPMWAILMPGEGIKFKVTSSGGDAKVAHLVFEVAEQLDENIDLREDEAFEARPDPFPTATYRLIAQ